MRDERLKDLKELLMAREYPEDLINIAIFKARKIPRKVALLKIKKKIKEIMPLFAIQYDPRLPAIHQIVGKHWRSMTGQDQYLAKCFEQHPLTAFRRQPNVRNCLIKSKIPPQQPHYPKRNVKGMTNCGKSCPACPFITNGNEIKINERITWRI